MAIDFQDTKQRILSIDHRGTEVQVWGTGPDLHWILQRLQWAELLGHVAEPQATAQANGGAGEFEGVGTRMASTKQQGAART